MVSRRSLRYVGHPITWEWPLYHRTETSISLMRTASSEKSFHAKRQTQRSVHFFENHTETSQQMFRGWQVKNFAVRGMAFSPDSTKLAIAQSDNIVFVYRLGPKWGEKKSITNKFSQSSAITTIAWPSAHSNELFFGLAEGKVKTVSRHSYIFMWCLKKTGKSEGE